MKRYPCLHKLANESAHNFVALLWHDLPDYWHDDIEDAQFDLALWLACFDMKHGEQHYAGFALLAEVRKRAEAYYQNNLRQPHHQPEEWAFFRFRLELAMLRTIQADQQAIERCYVWHDVTAALAHRIGRCGQERPDWSHDGPWKDTPF